MGRGARAVCCGSKRPNTTRRRRAVPLSILNDIENAKWVKEEIARARAR